MSHSAVINPRPAMKAKLTKNPSRSQILSRFDDTDFLLSSAGNSLYPPKKTAKLIQDDYALLSSMWWPRAAANRLQTCTFWFLWLFTWDDEVDQSTSDLFIHINKANDFRKESLEYVGFSPNRPLIRSLDVIGVHLQQVYNHYQIMTFVNEIDYYMSCQQREQKRKLTGRLPIVAEYQETRMGTSAVTLIFADGNDIPRDIMTDPKMISLWYEVNMNMSLSNDLLSLHKEIKHSDIDSMVPVLVSARGLTVRQAVKETEAEINRNMEGFDQIANALLEEIKLAHPEKVDEVPSYIVECHYNQMANVLWSLTTTRYGQGDVVWDAEGRIPIVIESVN
ncbi:isoprenoid synthase domain-containing protein [Aspergillus parasiticus]|uniref:Terpene synthase n=1 Tax=Aspergillus parasiticus TaxID=5067 RepID=A0A5N6DQ25_ASPPA|nr:isoprenoid synthase domain-containing protein [Aspergillus parasiticus]